MTKIDFKKELDFLYKASVKRVDFVDVPEFNFIMIDGKGNPKTKPEFKEAISLLYHVTYSIRNLPKNDFIPEGWFDYVVPPLEGLWWMEDKEFDVYKKEEWRWTMMIMQPEFVTPGLFEQVLTELKALKPNKDYSKLRLASFHEGLSMQIMHIGPYKNIYLSKEKINSFLHEKGLIYNGKQHELYFSDPQKTAPEKLKTLIRMPVCVKH